jgi:hypothetical protein
VVRFSYAAEVHLVCPLTSALEMESSGFTKTSLTASQTTQVHNPEDHNSNSRNIFTSLTFQQVQEHWSHAEVLNT